jgi:hypothetical protein
MLPKVWRQFGPPHRSHFQPRPQRAKPVNGQRRVHWWTRLVIWKVKEIGIRFLWRNTLIQTYKRAGAGMKDAVAIHESRLGFCQPRIRSGAEFVVGACQQVFARLVDSWSDIAFVVGTTTRLDRSAYQISDSLKVYRRPNEPPKFQQHFVGWIIFVHGLRCLTRHQRFLARLTPLGK